MQCLLYIYLVDGLAIRCACSYFLASSDLQFYSYLAMKRRLMPGWRCLLVGREDEYDKSQYNCTWSFQIIQWNTNPISGTADRSQGQRQCIATPPASASQTLSNFKTKMATALKQFIDVASLARNVNTAVFPNTQTAKCRLADLLGGDLPEVEVDQSAQRT